MRASYERIVRRTRVSGIMSDEDIGIPGGGNGGGGIPHNASDFEETLEALIRLARTERRDFLAYLLRMALIEARNNGPEKTFLPH